MNFTTDPRRLASAVSWAARRVPSKPDLPILAGMLIEFGYPQSHDVAFTGFDHEVSTTATLQPDELMERSAGRCVVSGRLLDALVKSLPPKPVTIDVSDEQMTLTCGPVRATLPLMPAEDYPSLPVAPEPIGQINAQQFAKEVGRVLPACDITGTIASLPALTGVHIAFGDHGLIVTASNRYQLATNSVSGWQMALGAAEQVDFPILVPGPVLDSVLKVCDYDGPLSIGVSDRETAVSFSTGTRTIVSRLLPAQQFPAGYGSRIPQRSETPTVINVEEVTDALKRAAMVQEDKEPVTLEFGERLILRAGSGKGQITAELSCDHVGPDVQITANPTYLMTAIGSVGEQAELTINGPLKPVLVTSPKDPTYLHTMMPIRRPR